MAGGGRDRDRLADAIRRLIDHAVVSEVPDSDVAEITAVLERIDERLRRHPGGATRPSTLPDFDDLQATFRGDPIIGDHNPLAPPVAVERDGDIIRGRANLGFAYEGPPGYVHGAIIAGVFDLLLGLANLASGTPGMTGTLTVRYRKPTRLHADLAFEARTDRKEGRKAIAVGTLHVDGVLTAEAEGVFVIPGMARAAEFLNRPS